VNETNETHETHEVDEIDEIERVVRAHPATIIFQDHLIEELRKIDHRCVRTYDGYGRCVRVTHTDDVRCVTDDGTPWPAWAASMTTKV
jgi:hypothetical protein